MRIVVLLLACVSLGLLGWVVQSRGTSVGEAAAQTSGLRLKSDLGEYQLIPLRRLPRSPEKSALDEYCSGYRAAKQSPLARSVEKLGWIVTSEAPLGRFRTVTFASGFNPGTSALCFARNANIAVFEGGALVALAYPKRPYQGPDSNSNPIPLGVVEPLEDGTGLLIWTDPPGTPVGELRVEGESLRLTARAKEHAYCQGLARVPDIYEKGIDTARRMLFARGWKPQHPAEKPGDGDMAREMAEMGLIEAEACSGTGVGFCNWAYRGKAGLLHVSTVGGALEPARNTVSSYYVECGAH